MTVHRLFDEYERRFHAAMLHMPRRDPAAPEQRQSIARVIRRSLGVREAWVPTIEAQPMDRRPIPGGEVRLMRCTTWPGVTGAALLYVPEGVPDDLAAGTTNERWPLVLLCCGHGKGGKHSPNYQAMARHLVSRGAMVVCHDNIGQGERVAMGHRDVVKPFACGISLQGLIVMEAMGWLRWARRQGAVDGARLAAIGNSGGGTLTLMLAPLCPELAALASTGYPCTFEFIARKEKKHCHCNILPGIVGQIEMWHALGCFAPRPLMIFQGKHDPLFPEDLFHHIARKLRGVYETLGAGACFQARVADGDHPWDAHRIAWIGEFLSETLSLPDPAPTPPVDQAIEQAYDRLLDAERDVCLGPDDAGLDADALAQQLTGRCVAGDPRLWDVFPLPVDDPAALPAVASRGTSAQILAQYQAFLGPGA